MLRAVKKNYVKKVGRKQKQPNDWCRTVRYRKMEAAAPLVVPESVQAAASAQAPLGGAGSEEERIVLSGTTTEMEVRAFIMSKAVRNDRTSSLYGWLSGLDAEKEGLNIQKNCDHRKVSVA